MKRILLVLVSLFSFSTASATIIDNDTYTTVNGLDWLDLSRTDGLTEAQITADATLDGWVYASDEQYDALLLEFFNLDSDFSRVNGVDRNSVISFTNLFGVTDVFFGITNSQGWLYGNGFRQLGGVSYSGTSTTVYTNFSTDFSASIYDGDSTYGTFLVRANNIPEPMPVALIGLGLLALRLTQRKKV